MRDKDEQVKLCEKYALTIEQAEDYFGIGSKKIRSLVSLYKDARWYLMNGERTLIKRRLFEDFLDQTQAI